MQPYSVLDLFKVGLGPSSSHTLGPMRAAERFIQHLNEKHLLDQVHQLRADLYGSLALTGVGHGTDKAVVLGFCGLDPATVDPEVADQTFLKVKTEEQLPLPGGPELRFSMAESVRFFRDIFLPEHPNGMRFTAEDEHGIALLSETWYSVGGGAIANELAKNSAQRDLLAEFPDKRPFPYFNADELLEQAQAHDRSIADITLANEIGLGTSEADVQAWCVHIIDAMFACLDRGMRLEGPLPGGIQVQRRASRMAQSLEKQAQDDQLSVIDWVSVYALAVNEENAAGGRVVTAPTNGSAGVIPAVLAYIRNHLPKLGETAERDFLLTSAAIGWLYKRNASISAAEMGCQGEIGVASSMAAAGLAAVLGGSAAQAEHAAEIAMEHHLGMTCDPIAGLVQIPCIERNAFGAVKAIQAARIALREPGDHRVSLDEVIETMRQTGEDMASKYKETAQGGLAVNVVVC
ncbi:L-serine ammonia-lyase [Saccharospirillum salsuginis]|uniref:L-serine dehydratase n=1 Tax=Saccharospirillum salsuginis TaxID=418750 RepID=A0A918KA22_9GAMM|nr:L-serine ammonia-lyase [Saccharospirillum salsuginis]GGX56183.1 L-serine dehydratase [Saccharospirillum salsuginis]